MIAAAAVKLCMILVKLLKDYLGTLANFFFVGGGGTGRDFFLGKSTRNVYFGLLFWEDVAVLKRT